MAALVDLKHNMFVTILMVRWLFTEGEVTQYFCETCMQTQPQALLFGFIIRSDAAFSLIWSAVYTVIYKPGKVS